MSGSVNNAFLFSISLMMGGVAFADDIPLVKIVNTFGIPARVTVEEQYLDKQSLPCTKRETKTFMVGFDSASQQWMLLAIQKPANLPDSCSIYVLHVSSIFVDSSAYATTEESEQEIEKTRKFTVNFNPNACRVENALNSGVTKVVELNVFGTAYTAKEGTFYCNYGEQ